MEEKKPLNSNEKLEKAKNIANSTKRIQNTYSNVSNKAIGLGRRILSFFTKLIFDDKLSVVSSLIIAIILFLVVNTNTTSVATNIKQSTILKNMPVKVVCNQEMYEIAGIPEYVDVMIAGELSDITLQKSQNTAYISCDLSNLIEGEYKISLTPNNFISKLDVYVMDYPTINVSIKKKLTESFKVSPTYINVNKMDNSYTISNTSLSNGEVMIRASQETLDNIALVRALIDVSNVTSSFVQTPTIVAYDNSGNVVNCDIISEGIQAECEVTRLSKEVPIVINPTGTLANNLAIDSITCDYSVVTIYGAQNVLDATSAIVVDLDVTNITSNTIKSIPLNKSSDISNMSVTKITVNINVDTKMSVVFNDIKTKWINNTHSQFAVTNTADSMLSVTITGTKKNVESITSSDVEIAFDMANTEVGVQNVPVVITVNNSYVNCSLTDGRTTVEVQIVE